MSESLYTELQWLAKPPEDFSRRCRALREASGEIGREVRALASFALDENKLSRLANAVAVVRGRPRRAATADAVSARNRQQCHFALHGAGLDCYGRSLWHRARMRRGELRPDHARSAVRGLRGQPARPDAVLRGHFRLSRPCARRPFGDTGVVAGVVERALEELLDCTRCAAEKFRRQLHLPDSREAGRIKLR